MATEVQVRANAKNAVNSTGPKTAAGKARSKLNARKLGLHTQSVLRPDDDPQELKRLLGDLCCHYQPVGSRELGLVDEIAAAKWRKLRFCRIETDTLYAYGCKESVSQSDAIAFALDQKNLAIITKLPPLEAAVERELQSLIKQLTALQTERKSKAGESREVEALTVAPLERVQFQTPV